MFKLVRPKFWQSKNILSFLLLPFSIIYYLAQRLRFIFANSYKSKAKTICIGNFVVGGAGKTPIAIEIGKFLNNKNFCYVTRGYKGSLKGPILVTNKLKDAYKIGDEALLLSNIGPTIIAKNKLEGLIFAENKGFEYVIFDDGMQNPYIKYDKIILAYDGLSGNGFLFPAGPLREIEHNALRRANHVILTTDIPISLEKYKQKTFVADIIPMVEIPKADLVLFAGIANPDKFFSFVEKLGAKIIKTYSFPDHYNYNDQDLEKLILFSNSNNAVLVTTEKDFVKINDKYKNSISCLPISYKIIELGKIMSDIT